VERLDSRAIDRLDGPNWQRLRPLFEEVSSALLSVSPNARGELTTIYVKFGSPSETAGEPYAVVWIKKSTEMVVGLALPDEVTSPLLGPPPPRHKYTGLTAYLTMKPGDAVPAELSTWAKIAFDNRRIRPSG